MPPDQHWTDLMEALEMEAEALGGFGEITVRIVYHSGQPREMQVRERLPHYRLGSSLPPLTGARRKVRMAGTE